MRNILKVVLNENDIKDIIAEKYDVGSWQVKINYGVDLVNEKYVNAEIDVCELERGEIEWKPKT